MKPNPISQYGKDLLRVKADLLCFGMRIAPNALPIVTAKYPYLFEEKFIHAAHLVLEKGILVNVCIAEHFAQFSQYMLEVEGSSLVLSKNGDRCCAAHIIPAPKWYEKTTSDGTKMSRVLSLHGTHIIADNHYLKCDYVDTGNQCLFCSFNGVESVDETVKVLRVKETVAEALKENPNYSVALSEGTRVTPDKGAIFFSELVCAIKSVRRDLAISVELAPPDDNKYIDLLVESGATALIMNLELYDDDLRRLFCPAKSLIPKARYFEAFDYAVRLLGKGQVSSVLIAGLQSKEMVMECTEKMISLGVIPTVMPFRPYDRCFLHNFSTTSPEDLLSIGNQVRQLLKKHGLKPSKQKGCAECGACAMEIDFWNFGETPFVLS